MNDLTSKSGAEYLALKIEDYWRTRGYPAIRAWIERLPARDDESRTLFVIKLPMTRMRSH